MDSEGIWNACTINVITKIAITTVPMSDCSEPTRSELKLFAGRELGPGAAAGAGSMRLLGSAMRAGVSAGTGNAGGSVGETVGWFKESMNSTCPPPAGTLPPCFLSLSDVTPGKSTVVALH